MVFAAGTDPSPPISRTSIASRSSQPSTIPRRSVWSANGARRRRPVSQFCIKAWQLITHTAASPTYRRLRSPIAVNERDSVGSFRQTDQVWQAWQRTLEIARTLEARVVLFQCPKSFLPTSENLTNFSAFFRRVERESFRLAWEPRGEAWTRGRCPGAVRRVRPDSLRRSVRGRDRSMAI